MHTDQHSRKGPKVEVEGLVGVEDLVEVAVEVEVEVEDLVGVEDLVAVAVGVGAVEPGMAAALVGLDLGMAVVLVDLGMAVGLVELGAGLFPVSLGAATARGSLV